MNRLIVLAAAMAAVPAGAKPSLKDVPPICACDPLPMPRELPSQEALALGRRLAAAIDKEAIFQRVSQLVSLAESKGPPLPQRPTYPNGPIRAVPSLKPERYPGLGVVMQERALDHAGLAEAWRYPVEELKTMVAFVESDAGKKLVADHPPGSSAEVKDALASPLLEEDLWHVLCRVPLRSGPERGPHHDWKHLHPPTQFPVPIEPPGWCATLPAR